MKYSNIWDEGAAVYAKMAKDVSFYKKTNEHILTFVNLENINVVMDLGCGSHGLLQNNLIRKNPKIQRIYCVDFSFHMIEELKKSILIEQAIFINSDAESVSQHISDEIEVIFSNAAFWLFQTDNSLKNISALLQKGGRFIFNIAEWDFEFENSLTHPKYNYIDKEIVKRQLNYNKSRGTRTKLSEKELAEYLIKNSLKIIEREIIEIEVTREDWLKFYSIPTIVYRSFPDLDFHLASSILESAINEMEDDDFYPIKWVFYSTIKI